MRRLIVVALVAALATAAQAYVIGSRAVFKRFAEKQALDRVPSGELVGRAELFESGKARDVPMKLDLQLPTTCKAQLELPEGTASAILEKGRLQQDKAPPAFAALVQLACPLTLLRNVPASDAETALVRLSGTLGVDMSTVSLSRLGKRTAYVVGAKPRELDRPQVWFDKETTRPMRVIARQNGQLWDVRFEDGASVATGRRAPRTLEVWLKGEKQLALRLMTPGSEQDATGAPGAEEAEDDAE